MIPLLKQIRHPIAFVTCVIVAGFLALSIHVVMLGAGVPFPTSQPPIWARWLAQSVSTAGVLAFLTLARPRLEYRTFISRTLITFVIVAALREELRGAIMNGVVTWGWAYSAITLIEPLVRVLIVAVLCVIAVRWVRSGGSFILVALVTAAISVGAQNMAGVFLSALPAHFSSLARPDLYTFPYPMQVMVPAYLTFVEPLIATVAMIALIWDRMPSDRVARLALFAVLVATVKGVVGLTFINSFFSPQPLYLAMLSYSQFLLEFLALGLLSGAAWDFLGPEPHHEAGRADLRFIATKNPSM